MDGKIYDIPFLSRSDDNDFCCKDGEIESCIGGLVTDNSENEENSSFLQYTKNFKPEIPPTPLVKFALTASALKGWNTHPDVFPAKACVCNDPSTDNWGKVATSLLTEFYKDALDQKLFISPFLIMAAWKLKDGNLVSPSVPILLIPNSSLPIVSATSTPDSTEMDLKISVVAGKLNWQISLAENLRSWVGKIKSLEIMVSKPLLPINSIPSMIYRRNVINDAFSLFLDTGSQVSAEKPMSEESYSHAWIPSFSAGNKGVSPEMLDEFYSIASIPLSKLTSIDKFTPLSSNLDSFINIYDAGSYKPSYSMFSFKQADGAIDFKNKNLVWGISMVSPAYYGLEYVMGNYSPGVIPRWIFHPDPATTEYQYIDSDGVRRTIPLQKHPSLYGAYYWAGLSTLYENHAEARDIKAGEKQYYLPSHLWISNKSEYDVFEDAKLQDLECGEIMGICRAFRSSGLVATVSPTIYVFSNLGIFLYKESAAGLFSEAGLIANYILEDLESLRISATSIKFTTAEGERVTLTGTVAKNNLTSYSAPERIIVVADGKPIELVTRPLKLSGAGQIKKIKKIFIRGEFNSDEIEVEAFTSRDLRHWWKMASREKGSVLAFNHCRFRFLKLKIKGRPENGSTFHGLSII